MPTFESSTKDHKVEKLVALPVFVAEGYPKTYFPERGPWFMDLSDDRKVDLPADENELPLRLKLDDLEDKYVRVTIEVLPDPKESY